MFRRRSSRFVTITLPMNGPTRSTAAVSGEVVANPGVVGALLAAPVGLEPTIPHDTIPENRGGSSTLAASFDRVVEPGRCDQGAIDLLCPALRNTLRLTWL